MLEVPLCLGKKIKRLDHEQVKTPIFMGCFSEHLQLKVSPLRFIQTRKHAEGRGEPSVFDHLGWNRSVFCVFGEQETGPIISTGTWYLLQWDDGAVSCYTGNIGLLSFRVMFHLIDSPVSLWQAPNIRKSTSEWPHPLLTASSIIPIESC